jgi:hypothetical protein
MERIMSGNEEDWLAAGPGISPEAIQQGIDSMLKEPDDSERKNRRMAPGLGMTRGTNE